MTGDVERQAATRARPAFGSSQLQRIGLFLAVMGPGLITSVVDNDATGIAGYAVAGAHYGYALLWVLVLTTFVLAVIQEMVARLGSMTGKGLADLVRERFGVRITALGMLALLIANATTVVAEFAGIAGASEIFGVSRYITVPLAALLVFTVVVYGSYRRVEIVLLVGSLAFLSYIVTGFMAGPHWGHVARGSFVPTFHLTLPYLTILIGLVGTTITPWMLFYLQSTVVDKGLTEREYALEKLDVYAGSVILNVVAFFIVLTTAATLWVHNQPADTVTDVAESLRPLAGDFAGELFAIGLLNASLMAAAVLPLSTAYAVCEAFGWERSVNRPVREAPAFFGLFGGLLVVGGAAVLVPGIPLLALLFLPNVVGGILLPVVLVLMLRLVNDRRIMGDAVNTPRQNAVAAVTTAVMVILTLIYLVVAVLSASGVLSS